MLPLILLACGTPEPAQPARPAGVPETAVEVWLDPRGVHVGEQLVGSPQELLEDPVEGLFDPLVAALADTGQVFVRVADETPWMVVRKLVNSADRAGVDEVWLGTGARSWQPARPVRSRWARESCEPGSAPIVGLDRAWTFELHRNPDGLWALASARFRPVVQLEGGPVAQDELPVSCWSGATCALAGDGADACATAEPSAPQRVQVAGQWGCLLPIAKTPDDVMLIPEANVPFAAIGAVLDAFAARGQRPPTLGTPLVEGNDGPPLCTIAIRDRAALDRAAGAWLGRQLGEGG